jgi:hypothetical protein
VHWGIRGNPAYVSFLPNALHDAAPGITVNMALWASARAQWANITLAYGNYSWVGPGHASPFGVKHMGLLSRIFRPEQAAMERSLGTLARILDDDDYQNTLLPEHLRPARGATNSVNP